MFSHQCRVIRYYPYYKKAFERFSNLTKELEDTTPEQLDQVDQAMKETDPLGQLKRMHVAFNRGFYVVVSCDSSAAPGRELEGTRLTIQESHHPSTGYEFSIRMPGTPSRYSKFSIELDYIWGKIEAEYRKGPDLDIEEYSKLVMSLYFYWVIFSPLSRGTAACGILGICALHLAAGYCIRPPQPDGVQLDWEAILSSSPDAFLSQPTRAGETVLEWLRGRRVPLSEVDVEWGNVPLVSQLCPDIRKMQELLNHHTPRPAGGK